MADRITRAGVEVAIDADGGARITRSAVDVAIYPQAGGRLTRIGIDVMVSKPTAFVSGANPDIDFVF